MKNEDNSTETSTRNTNINNLSDNQFRDKTVKQLNELNETIEQTANKTQEEMRTETKLQTEVSLIRKKISVDEMKNSVGALNNRMTMTKDKIINFEDELQKALREQQKMQKTSKYLQGK